MTIRWWFTLGAGLRVPVFEGGRAQARASEAAARLRQQQARLDDLKGRVYYEVQAVFLDLRAAEDRVRVAEGALALARQQLEQAHDRFGAGVADNLEVVQAQEALADRSVQSGVNKCNAPVVDIAVEQQFPFAALLEPSGGNRRTVVAFSPLFLNVAFWLSFLTFFSVNWPNPPGCTSSWRPCITCFVSGPESYPFWPPTISWPYS